MIRANQQSFDVGLQFGRALAFHQAGNLAAAQLLYGQILDIDPEHFDALHLLGVLRYQQGRHEEAHELISSAYRADPTSAEALSNLGIVLQALGRNEEAIVACDGAIAIKPRHAEALNNRGMALRALNRPASAAMNFDRAIAIRPDFVDAHCNRAGLMDDLGRHQEAVAGYDMAIALRPDHFESHYGRGRALAELRQYDAALASFNRAAMLRPQDPGLRFRRGMMLTVLGRHQEALDDYDEVVAKEPDHAAALNHRGIALQELGRLDEADASYCRAIALRPDDANVHNNRGLLLQKLKRVEEALALHDHALAIRPDDVNALNNRGNALQALGHNHEALVAYDRALEIAPGDCRVLNNRGAAFNEIKMHQEALASLDEAIAIAPDYAEAHHNRGNALKGGKRLAEALESYERALAIGTALPYAFNGYADCAVNICDWTRTAQVEAELEARVTAKQSIISPFTLLEYDTTPALQLAGARNYIDHRLGGAPVPMHGGVHRHHDKLRIAYLSADFNRHATSHLMANLFERHDRAKFEITGISFGADDATDIRARVVASFDRFHDVRDISDRDAAKLINQLEIDIAVDIKGYTHDARPGILWHRPAPIQVNYLGYPGTMGADFIDYVLADAAVVPPGEERFYAEKIVRLPDCYQVNDSLRPIGERTPTRQEAGLPQHGFVFCCFNNNYKITAAVFDVWMHLLTAVDGSVLWLLRDNESAEDNLRREAAARGVDPARLVFAARVEQADHLARHRLAGLFLDTLPYNAHTTCSDALWAGLPVLTCRGNTFAGRVAASLLQSVGLPELITSSLADYAALALWLAQDAGLLGEIRKRLAENRLSCPLFDTDLSRRHIESAYMAMWRRWQRGESPKSFEVGASHDNESAREVTAVAC